MRRGLLTVVLGKQLHAVAARFLGGFDRFVVSAGNRHVPTENGHRPKTT